MSRDNPQQDACAADALRDVIGYLNYSSGTQDVKFLRGWDRLFREQVSDRESLERENVFPAVLCHLRQASESLQGQSQAFADLTQAHAVLDLLEQFLPAYREFHRDLLRHMSDAQLWQPYMVGKICEVILAEGAPYDEAERILPRAMRALNDFIGHRPVAVLEGQPSQPYAHEWVRPIPVYIQGVGVAVGRYEAILNKALDILKGLDDDLLLRAWFDLDLLSEIAFDPRAYDFDHPVNKRPNYHFGTWDPHSVDQKGFYRRFVVQQMTLEALLSRMEAMPKRTVEELTLEAAAVLVGTMLMASGTSGNAPDAHDSSVTLASLLPHIAAYRDDYYEQLLGSIKGTHGDRLRKEAEKLQQPLGGARQHLNHEIAVRRARQIQQVHLAHLFARMGYPEAARDQAGAVRVPSARISCEIYCALTAGHDAIEAGQLAEVPGHLTRIRDLVDRGIACGALVDPWNILGFGGHFSLFPAIENSIHDYRADELIELIEKVLGLCARAWSEAAAVDDAQLEESFSQALSQWTLWWDQFATPTVSGLKKIVAKEVEVSANLVAGALNAWHKAGAAAGDIRFWQMFVDQFDSPKGFQLVVEALLEQGDAIASMALMMQWVNQAERTPLEEGDASFHPLVMRWLNLVRRNAAENEESAAAQLRRFIELLEANAEDLWQVPQLELEGTQRRGDAKPHHDDEEDADDNDAADDDEEDLFGAAYEQMVYRDTTDDGVEDSLMEWGDAATDYELDHEAQRLQQRLAFLATVAELWRQAAGEVLKNPDADEQFAELLLQWRRAAADNYVRLVELLRQVHTHPIPLPSSSSQSLQEFDRRRMVKDAALEQIIRTCVETADAIRLLNVACRLTEADVSEQEPAEIRPGIDTDVMGAVAARDAAGVQERWESFLQSLGNRQTLYVPLARGGKPTQIVQARVLQKLVADLASWLPRLGLITETYRLLRTVQICEQEHPVGQSAVTEFDRLFDSGFRALVRAVLRASDAHSQREDEEHDQDLVDAVQQLTESMLKLWLDHSRTLRLSVVERLLSDGEWQNFVAFVKKFGRGIFTQSFLNPSNLRAILHQGVSTWIDEVADQPDTADELIYLSEVEDPNERRLALRSLELVIETIIENYREYRDYNATTTQSDRGDLLYSLIDFLRLRSEYDRVAWNLRPVVVAHEILLREMKDDAADIWRKALIDRTAETANLHCQRLQELTGTYGMRLPTVSARIHERFVRPLAIDRVRAWIEPAVYAADDDQPAKVFRKLEQELQKLCQEPTGAGLDIPDWLGALDEEVSQVQERQERAATETVGFQPSRLVTQWDDILRQLDEISLIGR